MNSFFTWLDEFSVFKIFILSISKSTNINYHQEKLLSVTGKIINLPFSVKHNPWYLNVFFSM